MVPDAVPVKIVVNQGSINGRRTVPEPATLMLLGLGVVGLGIAGRKKSGR